MAEEKETKPSARAERPSSGEAHRNPVGHQIAANKAAVAARLAAAPPAIRDTMVRCKALKGCLAGGQFRQAGDVFACERAEAKKYKDRGDLEEI